MYILYNTPIDVYYDPINNKIYIDLCYIGYRSHSPAIYLGEL